jgi:L-ascorbate metabolism protein UlaG (beta-lactamase superfamily)
MPAQPARVEEDERRRRTFERAKELDHYHRNRVRSPWQTGAGLTLSLRYLRSVAASLLRPTRATPPVRVPRPPAGEIAVTFVGHATALLTTAKARILTDPVLTNLLVGLRRASAASLHPDDAAEVDLVLLSHAHRDHLHRPSLRRLPRAATVIVPVRCADLVEDLGFARVVVLEPGQSFAHADVEVTAVAARHDGGRGVLVGAWRGTAGYVVRAPGASVYFAGDTGYFSGFEEIGRRLRPDVALLPITGYLPLPLRDSHMSPLDALYAFEDLGAGVMIPVAHGSFPLGYEPFDEPLRWLGELCAARGLGGRVVALQHGETHVARRSRVDEPRPVG